MSNDVVISPNENDRFTRRLVPKEEWLIEMLDESHIAAGLWEYPENHVFWEKIALSALPNDLISFEDLERFGIALLSTE